MPDASPATFDRPAALRIAQEWAFHHAHTAQQHYDQALDHHTEAERLAAINAHAARTASSNRRASAQQKFQRAERARAMADTWASVATALATPPTADGHPATYDSCLAVDTTKAQQALDNAEAPANRLSSRRT